MDPFGPEQDTSGGELFGASVVVNGGISVVVLVASVVVVTSIICCCVAAVVVVVGESGMSNLLHFIPEKSTWLVNRLTCVSLALCGMPDHRQHKYPIPSHV